MAEKDEMMTVNENAAEQKTKKAKKEKKEKRTDIFSALRKATAILRADM